MWHADWAPLRALKAELVESSKTILDSLPEDASILDFGSGASPYRSLFTSRSRVRYITCDIEGDVELRIERDGAIPMPDSAVDGVVSFQVLEHVPRPERYLAECWRVLKPGASLLLSTHGTWLYHPHPSDFHRWTRSGLIQEIESAGLEVVSTRSILGPLGWTTLFRLLGFATVLRRIPWLGAGMSRFLCILMNGRIVVEELVTPQGLRESDACIYLVRAIKPLVGASPRAAT